MKALIMVLPILPGKEEEWRRFMQELEEYPREYEDLRRRLGIRAGRVWLVRAACGEVALVYTEVEAPEEVVRRLAASEEPLDTWFKEKLLELHGYDLDGPSPRPEPELVFAYAPHQSLRGSSRSGVEEQTVILDAYLERISSNARNKESKND